MLESKEGTASWTNVTYTIDLCTALKRKDEVPDDQKCPGGTRCKLSLAYLLWYLQAADWKQYAELSA